ncbi:flagellar motor switch protein FliN [Bradyrhizobium liaoningense]|uniref:Flagellar motor switch protein FliN n=1 Tax=Bradyrhizobium cajani TaxID=1928661 RepID=A0A844TC80_9BRAD|nr:MULTISPECIES: flagellar motor switch protein FliN [Bradyrhizobium]MBR0741926.1 flagellar motor switch protein FliN [Bradyrhizobium liaoningense]MBR0846074.1 flagellar motor switch protein FliN [Bradyrhizobium liaoningense]MBR0860325.1 flagellar motor switch protein FliN [Bradyrhizobium liaoningense]MCP3371974.1 flagellar motor switch protein FliN [Bradyrhizobium cajani]MVT72240.1 flagellar motor switch protein FliN [Bradyrhizobium cajani]
MAQSFDYESATRASASDEGHSDASPLERLAEIAARTAEETGKFANVDAILRIPVTMQVVLGSATIPVANLMKLGRGAVVPLDHRVGEPVDVVVNGRIVARGEVVVVEEDNSRFGVSLTEIVGPLGQGDT